MAYKCSNCGFRSSLERFFRKETGGLLGWKQLVCEGCQSYQPTTREKWALPKLFIAPLVLGLTIWQHAGESDHVSTAMTLMVAGALLSLPLRICIHEAGHAFAAKLVGVQVWQVSVGQGPVARRWIVADVIFNIHRYAFTGGFTWYSPLKGEFQRLRQAIILLAGPGANLLGAIACFAAGYGLGLAGDIALPLTALCSGVGLSQLLMAISNLWPTRFHHEGYASDGQQLLDLMKRRPEPASTELVTIMDRFFKVANLTTLRQYDAAITEAARDLWTSPMKMYFASALLNALSRSQGDRAVIDYYLLHEEALQENILAPDDTERSRPWIQANVAWSAIKLADPAYLGLADKLSAAALAATPSQSVFVCTRGACLIWQGRTEDGLVMVGPALRDVENGIDKSELCRSLAFGWRQKGDDAKADAFDALSTHLATSVH